MGEGVGKPNTCMNINGFAYDDFQQLYFCKAELNLPERLEKQLGNPLTRFLKCIGVKLRVMNVFKVQKWNFLSFTMFSVSIFGMP